MLLVSNADAEFPAKGRFHQAFLLASASLALGCHPLGEGHILCV